VRKARAKSRRLVVPIALTIVLSATTVTAVTTALSVVAGCGDDDGPHVDAGVDTPII
jgi:preprotein translocase subunit SecF